MARGLCLARVVERCRRVADEPSRRLPCVDPGAAGMSQERLQEIETVVREALDQTLHARLRGGHRTTRQLVYLRAFGERQTTPSPLAMTTDTIFDLASLTKPIATATSVLLLVEQGQLDLDERVAGYLPEFGQNGKEAITVRQLLTHQSGLTPDNELADYADGPAQAWERICGLGLQPRPARSSCIAMWVLLCSANWCDVSVARASISLRSGVSFSHWDAGDPFLPGESLLHGRLQPKTRDHWMQGEVHDPRATCWAAWPATPDCFHSAEDLALYAQMLLDRGTGTAVGCWLPRPSTDDG